MCSPYTETHIPSAMCSLDSHETKYNDLLSNRGLGKSILGFLGLQALIFSLRIYNEKRKNPVRTFLSVTS